MGALPQEGRTFTYADYKSWELEAGERFELIYGEAYAMAGPNTQHQEILMGLLGQVYIYLQGKPCKVFPAPYDVRLFYEEDESDDTVVQPDIMIICDKNKLGPEGCRGAPDLVVEILSPSNTAIEMERKFRLYRQAGVLEYWIVDPGTPVEASQGRGSPPANRGLKTYYFKDSAIVTNSYGSGDTVPVAIFPDLNIALEQVFAE
jgi:Uma2 family endonuclease